jgi:hypothetical protein
MIKKYDSIRLPFGYLARTIFAGNLLEENAEYLTTLLQQGRIELITLLIVSIEIRGTLQLYKLLPSLD